MAKRTLRTLCFAYKVAGGNDDTVEPNEHGVYPIEESGFTNTLSMLRTRELTNPGLQFPKQTKCEENHVSRVRMEMKITRHRYMNSQEVF